MKRLVFLLCLSSFSPAYATPPELLSATGLYKDIHTRTVDPKNKAFLPQYPLWSDCADKKRWVYLPEGTKIDTSDMDHWVFPVGTVFWKEFSFQNKVVETRMITKIAAPAALASWEYESYQWKDDGTDAVLVPIMGVTNVAPTGCGSEHDIPSRYQCSSCHSRGGDIVLGFDAIQLSVDRDPNAPHQQLPTADMINLETLVMQGKLTVNPVTTKFSIQSSTPEGRAMMGYLHGNCGGCHNPSGQARVTGLLMRHTVNATKESDEPAFMTAVNQLTKFFEVPGCEVAKNSYRIEGSNPDVSALFVRMAARGDSNQMPPVGTKVADQKAKDLLTSWIHKIPAPAVVCTP